MSKYEKLWIYIKENDKEEYILSFNDVNIILGFELDHSLLKYKKELIEYGYIVDKISLKNKTIKIIKIKE